MTIKGLAVSMTLISALACAAPVSAKYNNEHDHQIVPVTHGVSAGDVNSNSAVIWSRTDREATMHVLVKGEHGRPIYRQVEVNADEDYTGKINIRGLKADTDYSYKVWFSAGEHHGKSHANKYATSGQFHTAPAAKQNSAVSFAWGGDLAGQNVCRDVNEGFPIFNSINASELDFFIGLGDMVYADGTCTDTGRYGNTQIPGNFDQAANMQDYWGHWKYNREDNGYAQLLASMPYYAIWDDHEVVNDFGPLHDTRDSAPYTPGQHLLPMGLRAYLDYNAIAEDANNPHRLYRNVQWGQHLELFFLDNRQYRDANSEDDSETLKKTMLGREQLTWLKEKLSASTATWKFIVSSVPMSIPTGYPPQNGRDGWGNFDQTTGFEQELADILGHMHGNDIDNVVFITTDVHFAEVFRYTPFSNDPNYQVHEFVTGPLNAGLFPNRDYDTTFGTESLFFYGPEGTVTSWEEAKPWMNFGQVEIDEQGVLNAMVRDVNGNAVYEMTLLPK